MMGKCKSNALIAAICGLFAIVLISQGENVSAAAIIVVAVRFSVSARREWIAKTPPEDVA